MAKVQRETLWNCLLKTGVYQWKQGKVLRRSTAGAIVLACVLASQALYFSVLLDLGETGSCLPWLSLPSFLATVPAAYWFVGVINIGGLWVAYRVINYPVFADFLIDVESEMTKVTWPTWDELKRATVVVLGVMFVFSLLLFGYDIAWQKILEWTGVLRLSSS